MNSLLSKRCLLENFSQQLRMAEEYVDKEFIEPLDDLLTASEGGLGGEGEGAEGEGVAHEGKGKGKGKAVDGGAFLETIHRHELLMMEMTDDLRENPQYSFAREELVMPKLTVDANVKVIERASVGERRERLRQSRIANSESKASDRFNSEFNLEYWKSVR